MSHYKNFSLLPLVALLLLLGAAPAMAHFTEQCPPDEDGIDTDGDGIVDNDHLCIQLGSGDGFSVMADGKVQYMFGFSDYGGLKNAGGNQGTPADTRLDPELMGNMWNDATNPGNMLGANFPSPKIEMREGQMLYLTLSNIGMMMRPDLFDPHTIHGHGFSEASSTFDGVPGASLSVNMGSSFTYFYNLFEPGTLAYHCHVEATEHMQMGMLANFFVKPIQDQGDPINGFTKFVYNDGDGATGYDVAYPLQLHSFDPDFHDASLEVQPLPFAMMDDRYPMINGRGYPDTTNPADLINQEGFAAQNESAAITATQGQRILLRLTSMSTIDTFTLTIPGIPMTVVGLGSRILRTDGDPAGAREFIYKTNSVNVSGGQGVDVILDTADVEPGTYFLYTTNLNHLSNHNEDYGGMMTEIVISQ
jgi:FtsP/CotA-like multicopper oxidase with cupredoxin domain